MPLDLENAFRELPPEEQAAIRTLSDGQHARASILNAILHYCFVYAPADAGAPHPSELLQVSDTEITSAEILAQLVDIWDQLRSTAFGLQLGEAIIQNFLKAFIVETSWQSMHPANERQRAIHESQTHIHRESVRMLFSTIWHTVTMAEEHEAKLAYVERLANIDVLTGLASRRALDAFLETHAHQDGVVIHIDLNNFKPINDKLGHATGDRALADCGGRIRALLPKNALAARYGGDEMVIVLPGTEIKIATTYARYLLDTILHGDKEKSLMPLIYEDLPLSASIGVADRQEGQTLMQTLQEADKYMFAAKDRGREGNVCSRLNTTESDLKKMARRKKIDESIRGVMPPFLYHALRSGHSAAR